MDQISLECPLTQNTSLLINWKWLFPSDGEEKHAHNSVRNGFVERSNDNTSSLTKYS